jgi:hypothetical protein
MSVLRAPFPECFWKDVVLARLSTFDASHRINNLRTDSKPYFWHASGLSRTKEPKADYNSRNRAFDPEFAIQEA